MSTKLSFDLKKLGITTFPIRDEFEKMGDFNIVIEVSGGDSKEVLESFVHYLNEALLSHTVNITFISEEKEKSDAS
jgi:hypothetical protein